MEPETKPFHAIKIKVDTDMDIEENEPISSTIKVEPDIVKCEPVMKVERPQLRVANLKPEIQEPDSSEQARTNISNTISFTSLTRPKKSDAVLEKERKMRFLREKFPKLESMVSDSAEHF